MKTILVATDFSPAASNAVDYAADMALCIKADLLLLHIVQVPISYSDVPVVITQEDLLRGVEQQIEELKQKLVAKTNGTLQIGTEVRMGGFFTELKAFCENSHPYAVIMGSQGTTAAERLFFGGHAAHAMRHLEWPLITIPPGARFSAIKKIGLACDFNKVVDTMPVEEVKMLVNDFNARLEVLNTGPEGTYDPEVVFESGLLQEMLAGLNPGYHFISSENIDKGIVDFADRNQIDLLIVLPKRHGLLGELVHKSHTKQLVLHSHVPVIALHL